MIGRIVRRLSATTLATMMLVLVAPTALAHEEHTQGDLSMVAGFGTEPAYAGQPNSVQLTLEHDGEPVVDLGNTLDVEVAFGDQTTALELEPFFSVGEFGTPGDYRAWFIPTRAGQYTFHFFGTIDGEEVDETFESGPATFSDVLSPQDIMFPAQDPSTGELAERIDREIPRLTESIDEVRAGAVQRAEDAAARAESAVDDARGARTFGLLGLVVGAFGLIVGAVALVAARRKA